LTAAGSSIDGTTLGANGGAQNVVLVTTNLPPYTPAGTNSVPTITFNGADNPNIHVLDRNAPGSVHAFTSSNQGLEVALTGAVTAPTFTGTAQGGTSTPINKMPPTVIANYILRVL
jgi:hypothetical protein